MSKQASSEETRGSTTCALVFGGQSDEHLISIHTAITFAKFLSGSTRVKTHFIYICEDGSFFSPSAEDLLGLPDEFFLNTDSLKRNRCFLEYREPNTPYIKGEKTGFQIFDVVYPIVLGRTGEDGALNALFKLFGQSVVGPESVHSGILFDKSLMKLVLTSLSIDTLPYIRVEGNACGKDTAKSISQRFGYPCIVKPASQGSSIGLSVCNAETELESALTMAFEFSSKVIVEPFIAVTEYFCYVWKQNGTIHLSSVTGIHPNNNFYDFDQKYIDYKSVNFTQTPDDMDFVAEIKRLSDYLYREFGGDGIWRIDFFADNSRKLYLNEINTIPAMVNVYGNSHPMDSDGNDLTTILSDIIEAAGRRFDA